jgi:ubiquinone/menaquinone biosynthesis C-methylase UbiE
MTEEMARYYAQQASYYDRIHKQSFDEVGVQAIIKMLHDTFLDKRVYEVACGTGRWTSYVAQVAKEVYAIDLNEEMLELSRAREYPPNVVTFARADAYSFNTNTVKFNGGLIGFWLSHVDRTLCVYNSETTSPNNLECRAEEKMRCLRIQMVA